MSAAFEELRKIAASGERFTCSSDLDGLVPVDVLTFDGHDDRLDSAEAATPGGAVTAARTMLDEVMGTREVVGFKPTATFFVNGVAVRHGLRRSDLYRGEDA